MKIVGISLKYEGYVNRKLEINSKVIDILKETSLLYKIGNGTGLMFGCRSQFNKSEMDKIFFDNSLQTNDFKCNDISLKVYTVCSEDEVDKKILEYKNKIYQFAKEEILNRMILLTNFQNELNQLEI